MVIYRINFLISDELETWLAAQPNRTSPVTRGTNYTEITYNHDVAQSISFKSELAKRLVFVDGSADNLNKYDTDLYTTANPPPSGGSGTPREDCVFSIDLSKTWTNIGATFVDVYLDTNGDGRSFQIDTNGKTQVKLYILWNKIGTGVQQVRVIEVGTTNVLVANTNVISGRNVTALTNIPAFATNSVKFYKIQALSSVAGDDPVIMGVRVYLK